MANQILSRLAGTLLNTFKVAKLTLDSSGLTAARTLTAPDSSGTIALVTTGTVLQVLTFTDAGSSTTSSTLSNVTSGAKTITPKSTNSTIIVECMATGVVTAGGAGTNTSGLTSLYNNTASTTFGNTSILGNVSSSGSNLQTNGVFVNMGVVTNTSTTAKSFLLYARYTDSACTVYATGQMWKITEVQN